MREEAYPEDTDSVEGAVRGPVWLDHAEHDVELPVDEEDDEEMMGVPELFEICATFFLNGVPDHDTEGKVHDPTSETWTGCEIGDDESEDTLTGCLCI